MTGRIGRFVEVDDTRGDVGFEVALVRSAPGVQWCEMTSADLDYNVLGSNAHFQAFTLLRGERFGVIRNEVQIKLMEYKLLQLSGCQRSGCSEYYAGEQFME